MRATTDAAHPHPGRAPARALALATAVVLAVAGGAPGAAADDPGPAARPASGATSSAATSDVSPGPRGAVAGWVPPLDRAPDALGVLAPFDPPAHDWLPGHRGVDLAADPGEVVRSPAPGVVTFAGPVAGRDVLVVLHDDGLRTSLEPVTATLAPGSRVGAGTPVGSVEVAPEGTTSTHHGGHCADVCVHWGVRRGDRYIDPLALLGDRPPIVLLPLG
jgi:murein DD-endopeptidase MepM/ murein hydrolase activator NlpD